MDKQDVARPEHHTANRRNELPWKDDAEWKKLVTKKSILYNLADMKCQEQANQSQKVDSWLPGAGEVGGDGEWLPLGTSFYLEEMKIF